MIKTEAVLIQPSGWISKHALFVPGACGDRWEAMILQARSLMQSCDVLMVMAQARYETSPCWFQLTDWIPRGATIMLPMFLDRALYVRDLKNPDAHGRLFNAQATRLRHAPPSNLAEVPRPVLGPALIYGPESIKGCDRYFRPIQHPSVSKNLRPVSEKD